VVHRGQPRHHRLDHHRRHHPGVSADLPLTWGNSQPSDVALGSDGNIWFTERFLSVIGRITPTGEITEFPLPKTGSYPEQIVAGADGNLWFTESGINKIGRINP
jgi:virginiamycin B lyase